MGKRRVYELAEERGLTSGELLERLERAGIRDKKPLSSLDESVVEAALSQTATEEGSSKAASVDGPKQKAAASGTAPAKKPAKQAARPKPAKPTARPKAARPAAKPATDKAVGMERLRLRRRVRQLRRVHDAQLKEVAGLAVELHRLDSPKHDELAAERLRAAASTDKELMALERQLSPDEVGGKCPNCGLYSRRTRFCLRCGEKLPGGHTFQPLSLPMALLAVVAIAGAWLLGGVNFGTQSGPDHNSAGATRAEMRAAALRRQQAARSKYRYLVATVKGSKIGVFSSPGRASPRRRCATRTPTARPWCSWCGRAPPAGRTFSCPRDRTAAPAGSASRACRSADTPTGWRSTSPTTS